MEIYTTNKAVLERALKQTSEMFDNNITWRRAPEYRRRSRNGKTVFHCTLKVRDSHGSGARKSSTGRAIPAACWHAHGKFFENIWRYDPEARIKTTMTDMRSPGDNWQGGEKNIGSIIQPLLMRKACDCE